MSCLVLSSYNLSYLVLYLFYFMFFYLIPFYFIITPFECFTDVNVLSRNKLACVWLFFKEDVRSRLMWLILHRWGDRRLLSSWWRDISNNTQLLPWTQGAAKISKGPSQPTAAAASRLLCISGLNRYEHFKSLCEIRRSYDLHGGRVRGPVSSVYFICVIMTVN